MILSYAGIRFLSNLDNSNPSIQHIPSCSAIVVVNAICMITESKTLWVQKSKLPEKTKMEYANGISKSGLQT